MSYRVAKEVAAHISEAKEDTFEGQDDFSRSGD